MRARLHRHTLRSTNASARARDLRGGTSSHRLADHQARTATHRCAGFQEARRGRRASVGRRRLPVLACAAEEGLRSEIHSTAGAESESATHHRRCSARPCPWARCSRLYGRRLGVSVETIFSPRWSRARTAFGRASVGAKMRGLRRGALAGARLRAGVALRADRPLRHALHEIAHLEMRAPTSAASLAVVFPAHPRAQEGVQSPSKDLRARTYDHHGNPRRSIQTPARSGDAPRACRARPFTPRADPPDHAFRRSGASRRARGGVWRRTSTARLPTSRGPLGPVHR